MTAISRTGSKYEVGSVHGRFQPPHLGHQEYILEAMERCAFLWIGIARPDVRESLPCDVAKHRASKASNPLTYFERISIIREMLLECGKTQDQFGFVPFPIDQPDRLPDFLPTSIPCFTTIYDQWNRHKVSELKRFGYQVEVLWERKDKQFSGHLIRESVAQSSGSWRNMVPPATRKAIADLDFRGRLLRLSSE